MRGRLQKKNGNWYVVLELKDEKGKRSQKWLSPCKELNITRPKSKREEKKIAEGFLVDKLQEVQHGTYFEPTTDSVSEYLDTWYKTYCEPNLRYSTLRLYEIQIRLHIKPALGDIPLAQLRPGHIQQLLAEKARTLSENTVKLIYVITKRALGHAVQWEYAPRNVCDAVIAPRVESPEVDCWTREEAKEFLEKVKQYRYYSLCLLALTTGMRRGELLGLRWADVDIDRQQVTIRQTRIGDENGGRYEKTKTKAGERTIDISAAVAAQLRKHKAEQSAEFLKSTSPKADEGLVFTSKRCKPYAPNSLSLSFDRVVELTGMRRITFHGMRHTHATMLIEDGVNIKAVAERMGHSGITVTLGTYAHVLPRIAKDIATKTDHLFSAE